MGGGGEFTNYVDKFWALGFLTTSPYVDISYLILNFDKSRHSWTTYPPPLVNIVCECPLTTTTKPSTLFFKIWQRFSQNLKKHRTSQECNFSLAAWSSSDKLLFSLPKAWTTISNSSIFLSLAECECSCSNRSLYLAVKSAYWLLASSRVVEGTPSARA